MPSRLVPIWQNDSITVNESEFSTTQSVPVSVPVPCHNILKQIDICDTCSKRSDPKNILGLVARLDPLGQTKNVGELPNTTQQQSKQRRTNWVIVNRTSGEVYLKRTRKHHPPQPGLWHQRVFVCFLAQMPPWENLSDLRYLRLNNCSERARWTTAALGQLNYSEISRHHSRIHILWHDAHVRENSLVDTNFIWLLPQQSPIRFKGPVSQFAKYFGGQRVSAMS